MIVVLRDFIKKSDNVWRFILHILTGAVSVIVHYAVMSLMLLVGVGPLLASGVGFLFGAITRFITAYHHVYTPSGSIPDTLPKFIIALIAQGCCNLIFLDVFMFLRIKVWLAQIITTVTMTFLNYVVYRIWVFK